MYDIIVCDKCEHPRKCKNGQCVCEDGFIGFKCEELLCPNNCSVNFEQGICDLAYGRCLCKTGWGGNACDVR